jgi:DNA-binding transcriptional regulator YdaS (Cro superfamily)
MQSALEKYRAATQTTLEQLGDILGVNKTTILRWEKRRIPAERVSEVERVTGIPRQKLRPDIFGRSQ